jgi:putative transposase
MPRIARVVLPEVALHVRQRGHNRSACFLQDRDYATYLDYLAFFARKHECLVHAYCLMTNHVHILITPLGEQSCGAFMKSLSQCYAQYMNRARSRTGSLWEGRFRSCLVTTDSYALACYRYIELNPVRAGMVDQPGDYAWSSYRANLQRVSEGLLTPHPAYEAVGDYRSLVDMELEQSVIDDIRKATNGGYVVGSLRKPRGRQMRKMGSVPI